MDKLVLTLSDYDVINKWYDGLGDGIFQKFKCPLSAIDIILFYNDNKEAYKLRVINTNNLYTVTYSRNNMVLGAVNFYILSKNKHRNKIIYASWDKNSNIGHIPYELVEYGWNVYVRCMMVMILSNIICPPKKYPRKPTEPRDEVREEPLDDFDDESKIYEERDGYTYILRLDEHGTPTFKVSKSRASPMGQFIVRGHYRHYKNGKIIWINEYIKGKGKNPIIFRSYKPSTKDSENLKEILEKNKKG